MARCVISAIVDTDDGNALRAACMVHVTIAPCWKDGEAPSPLPIHADLRCSRADVIRAWEIRTHRQRPLVIHNGDMTDDSHNLGDEAACSCRPEVLPAEETADVR
jgi:hypothetical protein